MLRVARNYAQLGTIVSLIWFDEKSTLTNDVNKTIGLYLTLKTELGLIFRPQSRSVSIDKSIG